MLNSKLTSGNIKFTYAFLGGVIEFNVTQSLWHLPGSIWNTDMHGQLLIFRLSGVCAFTCPCFLSLLHSFTLFIYFIFFSTPAAAPAITETETRVWLVVVFRVGKRRVGVIRGHIISRLQWWPCRRNVDNNSSTRQLLHLFVGAGSWRGGHGRGGVSRESLNSVTPQRSAITVAWWFSKLVCMYMYTCATASIVSGKIYHLCLNIYWSCSWSTPPPPPRLLPPAWLSLAHRPAGELWSVRSSNSDRRLPGAGL